MSYGLRLGFTLKPETSSPSALTGVPHLQRTTYPLLDATMKPIHDPNSFCNFTKLF